MRKLFSLLLFIGLFLACPKVFAVNSEQISDFDSKIDVTKDNVATVTETIQYDFAGNYRHGLKRYLPYSTQIAGTNNRYYYNFQLIDASQDGFAVKIDQYRSDNWQVIRLGDPNKTITGTHTYKIAYKLWPVVTKDEKGDYLNWNITGNYWEVPILQARALVSFQPDTKIIDSRCYSGQVGSTAQQCKIELIGNSLKVSSDSPINSGEGLTLNALLTANSFTNYLTPSSLPPVDWRKYIGFFVGAIVIIVGLIARLISYFRYKHKLSEQTVIAQYEPPAGLTPAHVGLIVDGSANMIEISATFIDLAVRGYIKIEQIAEKTVFKKARYKFYLLKDYSNGTQDYEKKLLDMLFVGGTKEIELDKIDKNQSAKTISEVQNSLKDALEQKGFYAKPPKKKYLGSMTVGFLAIVIIGFIVIKLSRSLSPSMIGWGFAVISILIATGIAKITKLSEKGYKEWALVAGFKLFLSITEKDRLKFTDAPEKKPEMFSKFLPFAIALGVEQQWAKQFEGMDISKSTGWYSSPSANYAPLYIATSFSSDFSSSISSSFAPTSSSGGFSGGGFSGGGGGGGGGGSW